MRIGILTYHRSQNYGAQLQAYALQTYLKGLGYDVRIVDYWPDYHRDIYRPKHFNEHVYANMSGVNKLTYWIRAKILNLHSWLRTYHTNQFVNKYLNVSSERAYDVLVYGSDQIWRKQHAEECPSYNPVYFGSGVYNSNYRIAYAASMGKNEAEENDVKFLQESLSQFAAISVRESDLHDFVINNLHLSAQLVCDPVLLLSQEQWQSFLPNRKASRTPYVFVYNIARCSNINRIALQLAKEKNLPIIEFHGYIDKLWIDKKHVDTASAGTFLHYLRDADYVVTSSFHGVALSLCFHKQFFFDTINELANRTESLLALMQLTGRNLSAAPEISKIDSINYEEVTLRLNKYANESRDWLTKMINMCYGK